MKKGTAISLIVIETEMINSEFTTSILVCLFMAHFESIVQVQTHRHTHTQCHWGSKAAYEKVINNNYRKTSNEIIWKKEHIEIRPKQPNRWNENVQFENAKTRMKKKRIVANYISISVESVFHLAHTCTALLRERQLKGNFRWRAFGFLG